MKSGSEGGGGGAPPMVVSHLNTSRVGLKLSEWKEFLKESPTVEHNVEATGVAPSVQAIGICTGIVWPRSIPAPPPHGTSAPFNDPPRGVHLILDECRGPRHTTVGGWWRHRTNDGSVWVGGGEGGLATL